MDEDMANLLRIFYMRLLLVRWVGRRHGLSAARFYDGRRRSRVTTSAAGFQVRKFRAEAAADHDQRRRACSRADPTSDCARVAPFERIDGLGLTGVFPACPATPSR
jgi:hypothetical protein